MRTPGSRLEEMRERTRREQLLRFVLPFAALAIGVLLWDLVVRINNIQPYVLPSPGLVFQTLIGDWSILWPSLLSTLSTTFQALLLAVFGGVGLAILFNQSRVIEHSFYPYAVILQVTPVVAIAPLLLIYLPQQAAVLMPQSGLTPQRLAELMGGFDRAALAAMAGRARALARPDAARHVADVCEQAARTP